MSEFIYTLPSHNRAASYSHIRVTPTTGAIGADVENLDLTRLSDEGFAELRQALLAHKVIFIRDQALSLRKSTLRIRWCLAYRLDLSGAPASIHPALWARHSSLWRRYLLRQSGPGV